MILIKIGLVLLSLQAVLSDEETYDMDTFFDGQDYNLNAMANALIKVKKEVDTLTALKVKWAKDILEIYEPYEPVTTPDYTAECPSPVAQEPSEEVINATLMVEKLENLTPTCPILRFPDRNFYYVHFDSDELVTYKQAKDMCHQRCGMSLLEIDSMEKNKMIVSFVKWYADRLNLWPSSGQFWFWLGATTDDYGESWKWESGKPFDYAQWGPEQDNVRDRAHNCASFGVYKESSSWHGNWWLDEDYCNTKQSFICTW